MDAIRQMQGVEGGHLSTTCAGLADSRVLHCQGRMDCEPHGCSRPMTARLKQREPVGKSRGFGPHRGLAGTYSGDSCRERKRKGLVPHRGLAGTCSGDSCWEGEREGVSRDSMHLTAGWMDREQEGSSRDS